MDKWGRPTYIYLQTKWGHKGINEQMEHEKLPLDLSILLTPQELKIVTLMHKGLSVRQIAEELDISYYTARSHLRNIRSKTGMNRINLVIALERMNEHETV